MSHDTTPPPTTTNPTSPAALTDREIADRIDHAAQLIETNGKADGSYWGDLHEYYEPGAPCCVIAALGVATLGEQVTADELDYVFAGGTVLGQDNGTFVTLTPNPVLAAFTRLAGFTTAGEVADWSDDVEDTEAVTKLRDAATRLRTTTGSGQPAGPTAPAVPAGATANEVSGSRP